MKPSTERKVIRWVHILFSIPVVGYLYGPVATIPQAAFVTRWVFFPIIVLSGIWLWKGQWLKKYFQKKKSEHAKE
jgi:hypothetical protein